MVPFGIQMVYQTFWYTNGIPCTKMVLRLYQTVPFGIPFGTINILVYHFAFQLPAADLYLIIWYTIGIPCRTNLVYQMVRHGIPNF